MISAFYQQRIVIEDYFDLTALTLTAECHCALRIVSTALDSSFIHNRFSLEIQPVDAMNLLEPAAKLRNKSLFKDCVILACGSWPFPEFKFPKADEPLPRPEIMKLLNNTHNFIGAQVAEVEWALHNFLSHNPLNGDSKVDDPFKVMREDVQKSLETLKWQHGQEEKHLRMPKYYRQITKMSVHCKNIFGFEGAHTRLFLLPSLQVGPGSVLKNSMTLNRGAVAGEGKYEHFFLFPEISDDDLPWDTTEADW